VDEIAVLHNREEPTTRKNFIKKLKGTASEFFIEEVMEGAQPPPWENIKAKFKDHFGKMKRNGKRKSTKPTNEKKKS